MTLLELIDEKIKGVEGLRDCNLERELQTLRALKAAAEAHQKNADEDYCGNRSTESVRSFQALTQIKSIIEGEEA